MEVPKFNLMLALPPSPPLSDGTVQISSLHILRELPYSKGAGHPFHASWRPMSAFSSAHPHIISGLPMLDLHSEVPNAYWLGGEEGEKYSALLLPYSGSSCHRKLLLF